MIDPIQKIMTSAQALEWRVSLRESGRSLVLTNGCFDLMHRGHAAYLVEARAAGDALLVALNSDASVAAIKGPGRPVVPESDRAYLLAALASVDTVMIFDDADALEVIRAIEPDVYVKGGNYREDTLNRDEHALLKEMDCEIRLVSLVDGLSTSDIIARIRSE